MSVIERMLGRESGDVPGPGGVVLVADAQA